ncbi:DUF7260 family protein [Halomontanus rarus]|uniref:DUF7260 family protein n=1 Tax=Halomontanus rarus TaxID=3034020 RepID=UPI0023E77A4F|nr:hypothetical protein [Halovivax sp. TS33]
MSLDRTVPTDIHGDVLETARLTLERERRELADERLAFERFLDRIRELEAVPSRPQSGSRTRSCPTDPAKRMGQQSAGLTAVRERFAETVTSVPHYYDRYDESVAEHLTGEFGEELAAAVLQGTHLHSRLKHALLEATRHAIDTRETVLEMIDDEREQLDRVETNLRSIADEFVAVASQPLDDLEFNALRLTRVRLCDLRDRCDDLATRRQEFVQRQRRTPLATGVDFSTYLYGTCEHRHPVLSIVATLGDHIERVLHRVERNLVVAR